MIYTHKEITQRDLNSIILANKQLKKIDFKPNGINPIGILNQMIFKFLAQHQIDYIIDKIEN